MSGFNLNEQSTRRYRKVNIHRASLGIVTNTTGVDEEVADGVEGGLTVDAEVEVVVGEDIDDVVDDGLVELEQPAPQHLVHHRARHLRHRRRRSSVQSDSRNGDEDAPEPNSEMVPMRAGVALLFFAAGGRIRN